MAFYIDKRYGFLDLKSIVCPVTVGLVGWFVLEKRHVHRAVISGARGYPREVTTFARYSSIFRQPHPNRDLMCETVLLIEYFDKAIQISVT